MDFCNSLYFELPQKETRKLQRLMNAAVRFIFNIRSRKTRITPYLKKAHLLPVNLRIRFKICTLTYKCLNETAPKYLCDLTSKKTSLESLRVFSDQTLLHMPRRNQHNYKNRRFEIAAPECWNSLPRSIREITSLENFKSKLKTYFLIIFSSTIKKTTS